MKVTITAAFEVYYTTSDTIEVSEEINLDDFDNKDEIYYYLLNKVQEEAKEYGYYEYGEPDFNENFYDEDEVEE